MNGSVARRKFPVLRLLIGMVGLGLAALLAVGGGGAMKVAKAAELAPTTVLTTILTSTVFLPLITNDYITLARRMGYDAIQSPITRYPALHALRAGWYVDWSVQVAPVRPDGIEHVQVIRVHQKLVCGQFQNGDRAACPYAQPLDYQFYPTQATIETAAKASPGDMWLI
ncbi:MAG: hypothetical protein NT075_05290, partial [Chloroflexi bacterium]|nr:hypothetical protein [Chloroflexota bacterium]